MQDVQCYNASRKSQTFLLPGRFTYNCSGFYGVDHLLQGLQVGVLMSKLLLLVIKMASSLNLGKRMFFSLKIPNGAMLHREGYL